MFETLINAAVNCGVILMYAAVMAIIIGIARILVKKIYTDLTEAKRISDSVRTTEHVYHEERRAM